MTRLQLLGALGALLLACGLLLHDALRSPDVPFVVQRGDARWIASPRSVALDTYLGGEGAGRPARFRRRFTADANGEATVHVQSLGRTTLRLNDRPVPLPAGDRDCLKRRCSADLRGFLRAGENEIVAVVESDVGPPLLRLQLEAVGASLVTDGRWEVAVGDGAAAAAVAADDTRPFEEAASQTTPLAEARAQAPVLAGLFALSAGLFLLLRRLPPEARWLLPTMSLVFVALFWVALFARKLTLLPPEIGYDARYHVEYVRWLLERRALPLATDGVSMYHPPLFYAGAAGLAGLFGGVAGLKLLPFLCGLFTVVVARSLARLLYREDALRQAFTVVCAGFLPLNVYMAAYVSNEPLLALLTGAALLATARILLADRAGPGALAALGILLGLAALTKYTALLLAPIFLLVVGVKLVLVERRSPGRAALLCAGVAAAVAVIAGWVYVRNWIHFGNPVIWNLSLPGGVVYWQQPGFHTPAYYTSFGESLRHPYLSLFHSFWDALYSTLWGVGNPPSVYSLAERHDLWRYDFMSLGYLLALPATAIGLGGVGAVAAASLRGDDERRRLVFTLITVLLFALGYAVIQGQLRFPLWGGARMAYVLSVVVPLSLCGAAGLGAVDDWLARPGRLALRALFYGWLGTFVGAIALSYLG